MKTIIKNNIIKGIVYFAKDYFSKINAWFIVKSDKEKIFLASFTIFLSATVLYFGILSPIHSWRDYNQKSLLLQLESLNSIQNNSQKIYRELHSGNKPKNINEKISLIKNTAFKQNIQLSKIEIKENLIAVSSDDIAYQKVLKWLIMLENDYKVSVIDISISKAKKYGRVKIYIVLD
jgi:general secretion pathway protein M